MNAARRADEQAAWTMQLVDAEVKLYLLALIRTGSDHDQAKDMAMLDRVGARSARGWLSSVGILDEDGVVCSAFLHAHSGERIRDSFMFIDA